MVVKTHNLIEMENKMTSYMDDIKTYINMRIEQTEKYIAVEQLSGNAPKEFAEKAAQVELYGMLKFVEKLVGY